jgi:hypothetical protein
MSPAMMSWLVASVWWLITAPMLIVALLAQSRRKVLQTQTVLYAAHKLFDSYAE